MSCEESFRAALRQAGIEYSGPISIDGKLHRIKAGGDHSKNSWYVLYPGSPVAGAFGCWKRDFKETWCERGGSLTREERQNVRQRWQEATSKLKAETLTRQKKARKVAAWILERSRRAVTMHPYLYRKRVKVFGNLREYCRRLVVPLRDSGGELRSLQFIDKDGTKNFLTGGRIAGCFFVLADKAEGPLVICGGYSTGASIHKATGHAVICAMNSGNLPDVAKVARELWPQREIIVAADNDQFRDGNPGLTKATAAAKAIRAKLAVPQFKGLASKPTDFNDLAIAQGLDAVRQQVGSAQVLREIEREPVALPPPPAPYVPPPLDLFPSEVKRFIQAGAATFDVDRAFFLLPVLSGVAAMIGNARSIQLKEDYIEPSIIWTATIGPTGDGKSPAVHAATSSLQMREREFIRKNKEAYKAFAEDLARWEATPKTDRGEKPQKPPLLTCLMDDTTIEAVASRLNDNPRGVALVKDEFSHWFESMDQYHDRGGSDVSRWLSIWTGNLFALDRVTGGRSYRIANPRLSITGGVVPEKFKQLLTEDFFVRGLPARFLPAMPIRNQPRKWTGKSIPLEVKTEVNELFAQLAGLQPHKNGHDEECPVLLVLSAEAQKIFVDFYDECARRAYEADFREKAQWSKMSAYSARLALVGQLLWDPKTREISGNVMQAACELARWFGNEAERIYALIAETPGQQERRRLIEHIQKHGGRVTERDVYNNYRLLKNKPKETAAALDALVQDGFGEWQPVPTTPKGGKPTREFRLFEQPQTAIPPDLRGNAGSIAVADTHSSSGNKSQ